MAGARNLPGLIVAAAGSVVVSIERAKGEITYLSSIMLVVSLESISHLPF